MLFGDWIVGYHLASLILHAVCVSLLFRFLKKIGIGAQIALLLSAIFAVHPALTQAVAWIPGSNDALLFLFGILFLTDVLEYFSSPRNSVLARTGLWLLLALFTKESAIALLPAALLLPVKKPSSLKNRIVLCGASLLSVMVWYCAMLFAHATLQWTGIRSLSSDLFHRLPMIPQYTEKFFVPFNLGVYPTIPETVIWPGLLILAGLLTILIFDRKQRLTLFKALATFLVLLLPALLVPHAGINQVAFEHRVYLPSIGLMMFIGLSFNVTDEKIKLTFTRAAMACLVALSAVNYNRQSCFAGPEKFWADALRCSPSNAFVHLMRAENPDDPTMAKTEYYKALNLNPKLKYLNLRFGMYWYNHNQTDSSLKYFNNDYSLRKTFLCHYYYAHIAFRQHNYEAARNELRLFIMNDPEWDHKTDGRAILSLQEADFKKISDELAIKNRKCANKLVLITERMGIKDMKLFY